MIESEMSESELSERSSKSVVVVGGRGLKSDGRFVFEIRIESIRVTVVHLRAVVVEQKLQKVEMIELKRGRNDQTLIKRGRNDQTLIKRCRNYQTLIKRGRNNQTLLKRGRMFEY